MVLWPHRWHPLKSCLILIAGEDDTDRRAIISLIRSLNENAQEPLEKLKMINLRKPLVLSRNAERKKFSSFIDRLAAVARAERTSTVEPVVVLHQDCDEPEPAHVGVVNKLADAFQAADLKRYIIAAAAFEIETWWMLFPSAINAVRACWKDVDYGRLHVGGICDSKERLKRDLRPSGSARSRCPDLSEQDGPKIADKIREQKLIGQHSARADSFDRFVSEVHSVLSDPIFR